MSGYLHVYEAYRIPKGTKVQNADGEEVVLSNDEDTLVLTEESSRQLIKDRKGFVELLDRNADLAAQKTQEAASKKISQDQAKALAVFRSMSSGDIVPATDESKLMEYDKKFLIIGNKSAYTYKEIFDYIKNINTVKQMISSNVKSDNAAELLV